MMQNKYSMTCKRLDTLQTTYEALLYVYCAAGLFDEAKAQFLEMKEIGPTLEVTSYCQMVSISARRSR